MRLAFLIVFISLFLSGCLTNGSNNYSDYVLDINNKKINDYEREQKLIKANQAKNKSKSINDKKVEKLKTYEEISKENEARLKKLKTITKEDKERLRKKRKAVDAAGVVSPAKLTKPRRNASPQTIRIRNAKRDGTYDPKIIISSVGYDKIIKELPTCPGSPYVQVNLLEDNKNYWDNCIGTHITNNSDGDRSYVGEWKNNNYNGYGTYTTGNGNVYEGYWVNSKKDGKGTQTWISGNVWRGLFNNGNFIAGKKYTKLEYKRILIAREIQKKRQDEKNRIENAKKEKMDRIENAKQEEIKEKQTFENAKLECEAIGYKKGTEKFGECVLDLTE